MGNHEQENTQCKCVTEVRSCCFYAMLTTLEYFTRGHLYIHSSMPSLWSVQSNALSSADCSAVHNICPYDVINDTTFGKRNLIAHKMYVLIFSTTFV